MLYQLDFEMYPAKRSYAEDPQWEEDVIGYIDCVMDYVRTFNFYKIFDTQVQCLSSSYSSKSLCGEISFYVEGRVKEEEKEKFVRYINENFYDFIEILDGNEKMWNGAGLVEFKFYNFHYVAGAHC